MAANIGQSTDSQTSRHAIPFWTSLCHPWLLIQMLLCLCLFATVQHQQLRRGGAEAAEQQKLWQRHTAKHVPAPVTCPQACGRLLTHCPISQSKLTHLLEFCAELDTEFRQSLLGTHLTDQKPSELVNLQHTRRQAAL